MIPLTQRKAWYWVSFAISFLAASAVFVLRTKPELRFIAYPTDLFAVLNHELGHGIGAMFTGGWSSGLTILPGVGGYIYGTGDPAATLPAGYVGAAIIGSTLFFLTNISKWSDAWAFMYGAAILLLTVRMAVPPGVVQTFAYLGVGALIAYAFFSPKHRRIISFGVIVFVVVSILYLHFIVKYEDSTNLVMVVSLMWGSVLIVLGAAGKVIPSLFIMSVLNIFTALHSIERLQGLSLANSIIQHNDAAAYALTFNLNVQYVSTVWYIGSIAILGISVILTWVVVRKRAQAS